MTCIRPKSFRDFLTVFSLSIVIFLFSFVIPDTVFCETFGIKETQGKFVPKVEVTVGKKEVFIRKTNPNDQFTLFSLVLNKKNTNLVNNVAQLNVQWEMAGKLGKAIPFTGPRYDPSTGVFSDQWTKSTGLKIIDNGKLNLFARKTATDLFTIQIDDQTLVSSESAVEKDRTVQLGIGQDVSINVDKTSILFDESNLRKGEMLNVDNRSGFDQILGVELPVKGLLLYQIRRRIEQTQIPPENWERFTIPADSGIFIFLIAEPDPKALAQLDGTEIVIKVYQGNQIRGSRRIPIKVADDLKNPNADLSAITAEPGEPRSTLATTRTSGPTRGQDMTARTQPATATTETAKRPDRGVGPWIWILQILNLAFLVVIGSYGIFFMLPRIQVLEDRLAKNEMFLHGSREAIRGELEQIKKEILQRCLEETRE